MAEDPNPNPPTDAPLPSSAPVEPTDEPFLRRRRIAEAKRQFDEFLDLGAIDPAVKLYREREAAGEGWRLDSTRLQTVVEALQREKRWAEMAPFMDELVAEATKRANAVRITLAQICVKKLDRPARALELLSSLDHRSLSAMERDLAMEMMGRARVMQAAGVIEREGEGW